MGAEARAQRFMIEGWDPKYLWKCVCTGIYKLLVRHILHGRSRTPLSLYTDLNSNAATYKECYCYLVR